MLASALAAKSFSVVTIRSGSQYQYLGLTLSGDKVIVGSSGKEIGFVLNDDTTLADSKANKYLNVVDGNFVLSSTAQKGFSIDDEHLVYNSGDSFSVCPSDNTVEFSGSCDGGLGVALRVMLETDVADFKPSGSSSKATSTTSTKPTTTAKPTTATTLTTSYIKTVSCTSACKAKETSAPAASSDITPGKKFSLVAIHSGSQFQYVPIKNVPSHPHVFSVGGDEGSDLEVSFQDDKTSLVDLNGRGVNWDSSTGEVGLVAPFGRAPATSGFSIVDGDLALDGKQNWKACPSGDNKFSLATNDCVGGTGIALKIVYA